MKKLFRIAAAVCAVILTVCLTGCGKTAGNDLVQIPEDTYGSLDMYYYNGERVAKGSIYDGTVKAEIFSVLASVPAKKAENWSPAEVGSPVYGVKLGFGMGDNVFEAAWSNGYWITQTGEAYSFDYDFSNIWEKYNWENNSCGYSPAEVLPCSYYLFCGENGWLREYLSPAENLPEMPETLTAAVSKLDNDVLTVEFTNNGEREWSFGEAFRLQAQLDGEWYNIPTLPGDWAWIALGYLVMPQQTLTHDYDLSIYGTLPEGNYRIVTDSFSAEFYVKASRELTAASYPDHQYCKNESGEWNAEALEAAEIPPAMDGISVIVSAQDENSLTVRLTNWNYKYGEEAFKYGNAFHIEVFVDGKWYIVPTKDMDFAFPLTLNVLPENESREVTYDFFMYDPFPEGRYRIVNGNEFWAEFTAGTKIIPQNSLTEDVVRYVTVYYYDEYIDGSSSIIVEHIDKSPAISEILSVISAEPAEKADNLRGSIVKAPIFGISADDAGGWVFEGAWTNGYWINQYGEAYRLDLDMNLLKKMIVQYEGKSLSENVPIAQLPCGTYLCRDENGWIADFLRPSDKLTDEAPETVTAKTVYQTENSVTVQYTNNGERDWLYGEHFYLDVKLDGEWYDVPEKPGNWGFNDIGIVLPAGETRLETYSFNSYGGLPDGRYRITSNGFALEFDYNREQLMLQPADTVMETELPDE